MSDDRLIKGEYSGKTYQEACRRSKASGRSVGQELDDLAKEVTGAPAGGACGAPRRWSAAIPTTCGAGHRHASRLEARVCDRLLPWCTTQCYSLFQQVRLPLLALAPGKTGRPLYLTVDFAVFWSGSLIRLIDAKGRVSREWARGAAAVASSWGVPVEEVSADTLKLTTWPGTLP